MTPDMAGLPVSRQGVEDFLAGEWVEGIGPAFAKRLVDKFGTDAINVLENEPALAEDIPGLGPAKIATAAESLRRIKYPRQLLLFLYSCGIGNTFIGRIFGKYRGRTAEMVLQDPYSMIEDVWRLSFYTADKIGSRLGITDDDPRRLRGALVTAVKQYAEEGHLFATQEQAVARAAKLTGVPEESVALQVDDAVGSGRLVRSRGGLYLPVFYKAEKEGAARLSELLSADVEPIDELIIPPHDKFGHQYSKDQRDTIRMALSSPVMVLTGGPGSGKTTVLKAVIDTLKKEGKTVVLAAPTGRAAKRMTNLTGVEASTIHRLLGYREGEGYSHRTIKADVLIIDEGSMMEQVLLNHLLECLQPGTRVIIVGDVDQLPAIGAGDVLRDLISSGKVPVARLSGNFRQGDGSLIAGGACDINSGRYPESDPESDFVIIEENGTKAIHDRIIRLVSKELLVEKSISPREIQVVTPQQIGPLGARQLNVDLQAAVNPVGPELRRGATVFRLGDPVMQTANSRERGVYNGEVGCITEVASDGRNLTVSYSDGRTSVYDRTELSELVLAYATTVHKLQGSEVRYMVFPITMAHKPMLYRNLLYTGVSRARDLCVLVGDPDALRYAIDNNPNATRNSNFKHRLLLSAPKE